MHKFIAVIFLHLIYHAVDVVINLLVLTNTGVLAVLYSLCDQAACKRLRQIQIITAARLHSFSCKRSSSFISGVMVFLLCATDVSTFLIKISQPLCFQD